MRHHRDKRFSSSRRNYKRLQNFGIAVVPNQAAYFLSRERLVKGPRGKLRNWEMNLFPIRSKHAAASADCFQLPPDRVVELGMQIRF